MAFHYVLSKRNDTRYWRDISNKSFYTNRLVDSGLKVALECRMNNLDFFRSHGGGHYISTGMNYFGETTDEKISPQFRHIVQARKNELKKWNNSCKGKKSLLNFLKDTIYTV